MKTYTVIGKRVIYGDQHVLTGGTITLPDDVAAGLLRRKKIKTTTK